ncbi:hypothetical protein OQA88_7977 [Cercophora sp. LCS_1]
MHLPIPTAHILALENNNNNNNNCPRHVQRSDQGEEASSFYCGTEHADAAYHIFSARAGHLVKEGRHLRLPRWEKGSVLNYRVVGGSFPLKYVGLVKQTMADATDAWNKMDIGARFQLVGEGEPALFTVEYQNQQGQDLAIAFFPDSSPQDRIIKVYEGAVNRQSHLYLFKVFCHELGHVLGLRHEFSGTRNPESPSVELSEPNRKSIMIPFFGEHDDISIQESDVVALKQLHDMKDGSVFEGFTVTTVDPTALRQEGPLYSNGGYIGTGGMSAKESATGNSDEMNGGRFAVLIIGTLVVITVRVMVGFRSGMV